MSNKEKVHVTIDSNEESQNIKAVEIFVLHEDVESFDIKPLETGDFIVGDCIFERKTPEDFASSVQKGRLREQVDRLAAHEKRAWVLVEGNMEDYDNLEHSEMPSKSLRGMDASIEGRHGISVKYCSNPENLADIAIRIARKAVEEPSQIHVSDSNTVKEVPFIVKFFMNFDGIGLETAENLANEFPSVSEVTEATAEELQYADGVGPKTAETIIDTLQENFDKSKPKKQVKSIRI